MTLFGLLKFILNHPLNRSDRSAALGRFLRWQLSSRLIRCPVALPYVHGSRLLVSRGMTGATGNFYCGLHEASEMGFVLHALREGDLFVDIGANIGSYTILAAAAVRANVVSAEPLPETFAHLIENIRLNQVDQLVDAVCCGLSSQEGELSFVSSLDTMNRVALPGETLPTVTVPVRTLDDLCAGLEPSVMKIDVEGHEKAVLEGGGTVLRRESLAAVLMETNQSGQKYGVADDELFRIMADCGFVPCIYDPFERTLRRQAAIGANTIFVRDVEKLSERCAAAPRYSLVNGSI